FPAMGAMEIEADNTHLQRKHSLYRSLDEKFEIQKETYRGQQYSQIYFARLHHMRTLLYSLLPNWKPHLPVCTVLGLEEGKECIIVGTLYKHMKLKPTILDEYSKERSVVPLVKPHNFIHPDDHLVLEDESGRVKLGGTVLLPSKYVTGIVVALHGKDSGAGDFFVQDVLEAGLPPQIEQALKSSSIAYLLLGLGVNNPLPQNRMNFYHPYGIFGEDKYVVFVSGIRVGSNMSNPLQFQLLVDHITGHLGDVKVKLHIEQEQSIAAQIVHVVIAGNSVEIPNGLLNGQNLGSKEQSMLSEPIKELDILLTQIVAGVSVDIMPGPDDPANFSLPQQALNRCLFPGSSVYNTFRSCTNPHSFGLDDIRFLGTSGQNIDDLEKYSEATDKLEFMERTLRWRHLAPTAPNTLGCYPFSDRDPFLLEECPHVYFIGNQNKYETCLLTGTEGQSVRLISIPKFCETGVVVVLNMRNLECHALSFGTQFGT
ncbi:DNA polymerase alpha/delta/epsilon, subunit B, partial [Dillenia turbinata]